jgi:acetolactate synthase-1/2/3 large subunit
MTQTTTAAAVAAALAEAGIDRVFGLPGGEVLVLMEELRRAGIDFVLMRHEANAGLAAAVYGKLRRQPGVVLTTLGPGAANLLLPMSNAHLDQEPLLAITAQIPDEFPASHTHQLLPLHDIFRPVCRQVATITARNAGAIVHGAVGACMQRPYGTALLSLSAREASRSADHDHVSADRREPVASDENLRRARERAAALRQRLQGAARPLVLVGLGVSPDNATLLRQWIREWHLPVAVTPKVKGIVDETDATFVGVIGGMAADGLMCEAIEAADVRVGLGLDPVEIDKTWHAELAIEWVLEAPNAAVTDPPASALVDHAALLEALVAQEPPAVWDAPFATFQARRRQMLDDRPAASKTMWPGDLIRALSAVLPPETIVTTDVGSHKYLFGQFWPSREPETFWMSNGLSGMGYGLSAAIGAKLARPEVPVLAAVGDGGFSMNAQELETADRVGAPFITIVLEDGSYSLIKLAQEKRRLPPYRMDFGPIDTVKMADACGVRALRTGDPGEMATAVSDATAEGRSLVVAVPIDYTDYRRLF